MSTRTNETYTLVNNYLDILPSDTFTTICNRIPFEDILSLEATCPSYHSNWMTDKTWEQLNLNKYFNIVFSDCKNEKQAAKYSFILSKAIHAYVHYRNRLINAKEVSKIYKRFEGLMIRFPVFGAYLWSDLQHLSPAIADKKFQANLALLTTNEIQCGGDFLLRGLYNITCSESENVISQNQLDLISSLFTEAINAGATCSSYFAYKILGSKCDFDWHLSLGLLSQTKRDYRALDSLFLSNFMKTQEYSLKEIVYPSVMSSIVMTTPFSAFGETLQVSKAYLELYLNSTIETYGEENAPSYLYEHLDFLLKHSTKEEGAEPFEKYKSYSCKLSKLNEIFTNSYDSIEADHRIICRSFQCGEWEKAEKLLDQYQLIPDRDTSQLATWIRKAYIKFKLEKWEEAKSLFMGLFSLFKTNKITMQNSLSLYSFTVGQASPHTLEDKFKIGFLQDYAYINLKLKNYKVALHHYEQTIDQVFSCDNGFDYNDETFQECKFILDEIQKNISAEGFTIPAESSFNSYQAQVEAFYGNWNKVIALLEPRLNSIITDQDKFFETDIMRLARAYFKIENWEDAEQHYDDIYQNLVSKVYPSENQSNEINEEIDFYRDLAIIKINLGKDDEAEAICKNNIQRMLSFEEREDYYKFAALTFCEEMMIVYDENIPEFLTQMISQINERY